MYWCIHSAFCHKLLKYTAAKHGGTLSPQKTKSENILFWFKSPLPGVIRNEKVD